MTVKRGKLIENVTVAKFATVRMEGVKGVKLWKNLPLCRSNVWM